MNSDRNWRLPRLCSAFLAATLFGQDAAAQVTCTWSDGGGPDDLAVCKTDSFACPADPGHPRTCTEKSTCTAVSPGGAAYTYKRECSFVIQTSPPPLPPPPGGQPPPPPPGGGGEMPGPPTGGGTPSGPDPRQYDPSLAPCGEGSGSTGENVYTCMMSN